jgi:hypothetical protein
MLKIRLTEVGFGVDCDIVHIYRQPSLGHFLMEYCIHHHLKGSWQIGEPKKHDHWFKKALWGQKSSLPLVPLFIIYIVVPLVNIELCE